MAWNLRKNIQITIIPCDSPVEQKPPWQFLQYHLFWILPEMAITIVMYYSSPSANWSIENPSRKTSEMMFGLTKSWNLHNIVMIIFITISTKQKTASSVYRWLHTHATFDVICLPSFVRAIGHHFKSSVDE